MKNQVSAYNDGRNGIFPEWLIPYHDDARKQVQQELLKNDPEYIKFQELKKKFEGQ